MEFRSHQGDWKIHADAEVGVSVTRSDELVGQVPARDVESTVRMQREIGPADEAIAEALFDLIERDCAQRAGAPVQIPERAAVVLALAGWVGELQT